MWNPLMVYGHWRYNLEHHYLCGKSLEIVTIFNLKVWS